MTTTSIKVSKLVHSPRNGRQPDRFAADSDYHQTADIEAQILEFGLIHAPTVHAMPRGKFGVFIGGRRLLALQRLIERGDLPKDHEIDVTVRNETDLMLAEMSFAENESRVALPAVTEFETYSRLMAEGADIAAIARRYQVTELHVRQRMRLGQLHPDILAELAADRLTLDMAKAYGATTDQALQKRIFDQRPAMPYEVRAVMKRDLVNAGADRMMSLVGMEAYNNAGGRAEEDLFTPGEARLLDLDILRVLYDAKLEAEEARLALPANVTIQFGMEGLGRRVEIVDDLSPEQRQRQLEIDREMLLLDLKLERIAEFDQDGPFPRFVAIAGAEQSEIDRIVHQRRHLQSESEAIAESSGYPDGPLIAAAEVANGALVVSGFYRPYGWNAPAAAPAALTTKQATTAALVEAARAPRVANGFAREGFGVSTSSLVQPEQLAKTEFGLSKDAMEVMRSHRRLVLASGMLGSALGQRLGMRYLIFVLARGMLREGGVDKADALGVDRIPLTDHDPGLAREDLAAQPGAETVHDAITHVQRMEWMVEPDPDTAFRIFSRIGTIDLERAAAAVAARMLSRSLNMPGFGVPIHDTMAEFLNLTDANVREHWTPDERFFERLPKGRRMDALRDVDPAVATRLANLGNGELTKAAAAIMSGNSASDQFGVNADGRRRARDWVPDYLSFEDRDPALVVEDPAEEPARFPKAHEAFTPTTPNPSGVYEPTETLECPAVGKRKHAPASIELLELPDGWRSVSSSSLSNGSGHSAPLTGRDPAHPTRELAIAAAAAGLRMRMVDQGTAEAKAVIRWIGSLFPDPPGAPAMAVDSAQQDLAA